MQQAVHILADHRARIDPFRERIEAAIERLIAVLDSLDDDPDLEPTMAGTIAPGLDECEPESCFEDEPDEEDGGDDEPLLVIC